MSNPHRQTGRLRFGRQSLSGACYFVTACTRSRKPIFAEAPAAANARNILSRLVGDGDARWLAGTVMPDHIHCLFELGARLSFAECLAKVKGLISRTLSSGASVWQENALSTGFGRANIPGASSGVPDPKGMKTPKDTPSISS
jgi:REP element-mobilizing transposase RayT